MTKKTVIITIFLILILVVIFSFNRLNEAKRLEYYNNISKDMLNASKEYFNDYKYYLPREINSETRVLLSALVTEKYMEMLKDYTGNDCDKSKSYVEVEKTSNKDYLYKVHLVCDKDNYETKDVE